MPDLSVNRCSKTMLTHVLLSFLFLQPWFHSDAFWSFGIFLVFVLWVETNIIKIQCYYFFPVRRHLFSVNTIFFIDENISIEIYIPKQKYFIKVFHVSWNAPKIVFHEILWKKYFTVYLCLKKIQIYRNDWLTLILDSLTNDLIWFTFITIFSTELKKQKCMKQNWGDYFRR